MKCYKKIISFSLAFAILFSSVPAFATDISTEDSHTFWGWMTHNAERGAHWLDWPLVGNLIHDLAAGGSEYVCPASSDGWHHASDFDSIGLILLGLIIFAPVLIAMISLGFMRKMLVVYMIRPCQSFLPIQLPAMVG